jgi:8-oxo-dGTP diphosphatase
LHRLTTLDPGEPRFCGRCAHPLEPRAEGGRERPRCPDCGWTYYAKPALGAAILIEEEGRVLLVSRAHDPYQGWWMLPAGFVEYGEDAAETAAREALEETGLLVEVAGYQGIYFGGGDPRGVSHLSVFLARRVGGRLQAGDDAAEARWFGRDEIPERIAFEAHRKALTRWQRAQPNPRLEPALLLFAGTGPAPPVLVYSVIENPKGTCDRVKYDSRLHEFVPNGEVFSAPLPVHYGWIPRTKSPGDGRELDVVVAGDGETTVGSVVAVRPIGALLREGGDDKVLAVRADCPSPYAAIADVAEAPELRQTAEALFEARGPLRGWASAGAARTLIMESQAAWIADQRRNG